ncbi:MAG: AAA family ATPase [Pseudomonadota bacterium]
MSANPAHLRIIQAQALLDEDADRAEHSALNDSGVDNLPPFPPIDAYAADPLAVDMRRDHGAAHKPVSTADTPTRAPAPLILRPLHEIVAEEREPEWLLHKIFEACVLAVLAGPRGTFKSFIALHWAILMAIAGHAGVILSGEGAGLDRRGAAWMRQHGKGLKLADLPLVALERPINLNLTAAMVSLTAAIAALPRRPAFIVIDTFSKFSAGLDENDNSEVATFLSGLSYHLREELGCSVLLVAHSGHSDDRRPRGASTLMANPDCEYIVSRAPGSMVVTVTRDRFKDAASMPPLAYEATVIDLGRNDRFGDPVTSLALIATEPESPKPKAGGRNQEKAVVALREWCRANPEATAISSIDVRAIFKTLGLDNKRRPEILNYLVAAKAITPSVGGFTIDRAML